MKKADTIKELKERMSKIKPEACAFCGEITIVGQYHQWPDDSGVWKSRIFCKGKNKIGKEKDCYKFATSSC
jgi:hypothetical protein